MRSSVRIDTVRARAPLVGRDDPPHRTHPLASPREVVTGFLAVWGRHPVGGQPTAGARREWTDGGMISPNQGTCDISAKEPRSPWHAADDDDGRGMRRRGRGGVEYVEAQGHVVGRHASVTAHVAVRRVRASRGIRFGNSLHGPPWLTPASAGLDPATCRRDDWRGEECATSDFASRCRIISSRNGAVAVALRQTTIT